MVEPLCWVSQDEMAGCAEDSGFGESGNTGDHHRVEQIRKLGQEVGGSDLLAPSGSYGVRLGFQTVWSCLGGHWQ